MAYLGNVPARSFISFERQVFTIVNSQTAYTLDHSVNNENDIRLVINNIVQEPGSGKAYTASGTTLTLSAALVNGTDEMYCVFLGRATATNAPAAGSVNTAAIAADAITEAKIADDAVESEHLNDNVISGQTELAAEPADTDEFLVSDAGTLKRIDYSYIKAPEGGGMTLLHTFTTSSATSFTQDITTTGYNILYGTIQSINHASLVPDFYIQFNSDTGNNYRYLRTVVDGSGNTSTSTADTNGIYFNFTGVDGFDPVNNAGAFFLHNPTTTGYKSFQQVSGGARSGNEIVIDTSGIYVSSAAITSIQIKSSSTVTGGTVKIYGMK